VSLWLGAKARTPRTCRRSRHPRRAHPRR
jgi:hypothetical protein